MEFKEKTMEKTATYDFVVNDEELTRVGPGENTRYEEALKNDDGRNVRILSFVDFLEIVNLTADALEKLKMPTVKKQEFSADIETLTGTLETRSEQAKQALKNSALNLTKITVIGTRQSRLNTEIEPHNEVSKKFNVDGGTPLGFYCLSGK